MHFIRQYKNTHAFINVHHFINELLQVGNRVKWFPQFGGVGLPLHTKQQVSGTETGEEQVIGWHVFRAQKMFPFWEKRGRQNSLLFTCQSTNCRWQGSRTPRFLQTCLFGQRRSPNNVITLFSEVLKHSSKNIMRYYIYLALVQNKLHFLSPHKDTLTQAVAELPCKVMSCWSEKKKEKGSESCSRTFKPATTCSSTWQISNKAVSVLPWNQRLDRDCGKNGTSYLLTIEEKHGRNVWG